MIVLLMLLMSTKFGAGYDECHPTRCKGSGSGPIIGFPFRLKDHQPTRCGYSGFDLSCNPKNNSTEFVFRIQPIHPNLKHTIPLSLKATVKHIDYKRQSIRVHILFDPDPCPVSISKPFEINVNPGSNYAGQLSLFNCSQVLIVSGWRMTCLDRDDLYLYAVNSEHNMEPYELQSNCTKMYNIGYSFNRGLMLRWDKPDCRRCGMYCRLKNGTTNDEIECFNGQGKLIIARAAVGAFLVVVAIVVLFRVYYVRNKRIQRFLEDYNALATTRYTYLDLKKFTDGFKHKLGSGGYGTVFKGFITSDIPIAVKVLNNVKGKGDEFINEVGTIGKIHHINVVRLVGYCADGYKRALVYEFLENDSLEKYIMLDNHRRTLGLEKLHQIALGVARGIDYLHQGCNQRILHFDIKPHNILLDANLNPKVADFGLAKLCSKEQSVVTMTAIRGTIGYIAPEVFSRNFGRVSYKSDIYSFGMLLLDMVGGRKNFDAMAHQDSEAYFPEWMYSQLEKGEAIEIQIGEENEIDTLRRLIIVGLWCIQWHPVDRPSMKIVIQMLEGENMPSMPPNPFATNTTIEDSKTSSTPSFSSGDPSLDSSIIEE